MFNRKKKEEPKKKKKQIPLILALLIMAVVFLLFIVHVTLSNFLATALKYTAEATENVIMLDYAVNESDMNTQEILQTYRETTLSRLRFAGDLYEKGLFETDPERIKTILGDDTYYYLLDSEGKVIEGQNDLPVSESDLASAFEMVTEKEQWIPFGMAGYSAFFHKLTNGGYILGIYPSSIEDSLVRSLYDSGSVVAEANSSDGFAIADVNGYYYSGPEKLVGYIGDEIENVITPLSPKMEEEGRELSIYLGGVDYELYVIAEKSFLEEEENRLYYLISLARILKQSSFLVAVISMAVLFGVLLILYFIYQYRKANPIEGPLVEKDRKIKTRILVLAAVVFTGLVTYYMRTLFSYSANVLDDAKELMEVIDLCEDRADSAEDLKKIFTSMYSRQTEMIGKYLSEYPEERTEGELKSLSDTFGLEYMILFDQDGNELLSDADYINLSLSNNKNDLSWNFRTLLNGTKTLVADVEKDDLTGLSHQLIGTQIRSREGQPDGLLICAYNSDFINKVIKENSVNSVLSMKSDLEKNDYYLVDPETSHMIFSPRGGSEGMPAEDYGFTEEILKKGYSGTITIDGEKNSTTQDELNEKYLYIVLPYSEIFGDRIGFSAYVCLNALIVILIGVALFNRVKIREAETTENQKTPEEKTTRAMILLARIFGVILALVLVFRHSLLSPDSIINYVMDMRWRPGINVFALTAVLILILLTAIAVRFVRYMLVLLTQVSSSSAETYFRLMRSAVEYLSVIIVGYTAMQMLGANMTALITTTGAMTLLVGMGAQDLTADIIAGLFLMFEAEFQVGDVIDVKGTIGTVKEIGLHATKLIDEDNNILIINNSDIRNLINRTQNSSFIFVTFALSMDVPIHELEEIFKEELPKLKAKYPQLLSEPYFKGADNFSGGEMECTVAAETNESDRVTMERILNREIQKILKDHNIEIG